MAKRLVAKTGTYQKDGQEKGEYVRLGVELSNDNGSYMLLDPAVSLAGILAKQNVLAAKAGQPQRDMVMISVFTDEPQQQGGYQQQQQHRQQPQRQQPGGYQPQQPQQQPQQQHQPVVLNGFDAEIPF